MKSRKVGKIDRNDSIQVGVNSQYLGTKNEKT